MLKEKKRAKRRFNNYNKAIKQKTIFKEILKEESEKPLGYFFKMHSLNCGRTLCCMCGNPRRNKKLKEKEKIQELKHKENININNYENFY